MTDWASGYVSDVAYTAGYYPELNPMRLRLAFLAQGLVMPEVRHACELGFGQGLSVAMHAAGSEVQWSGSDFLPAQAGFACELVGASGRNADLSDQSFEEFCGRTDLPDFDFIAMHGVWSWVSDANRVILADFIRRKLKLGGVVFVSYNTYPGWSMFAPVRNLLVEHARLLGAEGQDITLRIDAAFAFAEEILANQPAFVRANPLLIERFDLLKKMNRRYLAHEFFNRDWRPMYFAEVANAMTEAKLQFACSATYLDHVDGVNFLPEHQACVKALANAHLRETVRDIIVNQQFRRDYWVKGLRRLTPVEQVEAMLGEHIALISPLSDVPKNIQGALGEAQLNGKVYPAILEILSDHAPRSIGEIEELLRPKGVMLTDIIEAVLVLIGVRCVTSVYAPEAVPSLKAHTDSLNMHLMNKARGGAEIAYLASPVTGGGIAMSRFEQLFLASISTGRTAPGEWADDVWTLLNSQGETMRHGDGSIMSPSECLEFLQATASKFAEAKLAICSAMGLVQ